MHDVAMTFDDLPYVTRGRLSPGEAQKAALEANNAILAILREEAIPATAFVNEAGVEALGPTGRQILALWNDGPFSLANHGFHHFDSNGLDPVRVEAEIVQAEATIRPLSAEKGRKLEFFRFPYNHTGDTEVKRAQFSEILHRHGYRLAATTIDVEDYIFNDAYECALSHGHRDDASRIAKAYIDYVRIELPYYRALDSKVMGREIPSVMLLHSNRLNAATLREVIAVFRADRTRFITLDQAQSDPAYAREPEMATGYGPMWGYRWAHERHVRVDGTLEKEAPPWVVSYCAQAEGAH